MKRDTWIEKIIRILSLILIVVFFVPTFLVSCGGKTIEISAVDMTMGVKYQGEYITAPNYICLLYILLPILILLITFVATKITNRIAGIIILGLGIGDIIAWIFLRSNVIEIAQEQYCKVATTGWYTVNLIILIFVTILGGLLSSVREYKPRIIDV